MACCAPNTSSCCPPPPPAKGATPDGIVMGAQTTAQVREYYGETLKSTSDLKTSACCVSGTVAPHIKEILAKIPDAVISKFYGCGAPLPLGIDGMRVLDLGSGSGRDCYVASALVGSKGSVVGVDMTDEQLEVARAHVDDWTVTLGYRKPNMRFVAGQIEDLRTAGITDNSIDLIISNCVVNLATDKRAVLQEAFRVLADGGEFHFSDVYCDRRLPADIRADPVLVGECLGGALYIEDFKRLCDEVGFLSPRFVAVTPIAITNAAIADVLGEARFSSVTFRLFKLPKGLLETSSEDYGQFATYKGTIPRCSHAYQLDAGHRFETGRAFAVCGNTAALVGNTWLGKHFDVHGDRSTHFGLFNCGTAAAATSGGVAVGLSSC